MNERSWRGTWWVPDEPDTTRDGTLYFAEDGHLRLELIGGFDIEIRTPLPNGQGYAVSMESRDFPTIHGVAEGVRFTLLDSHATHTSGPGFWRRNIARQDLSPHRALRGIHLLNDEEVVFTRGYLQLERLLAWANRSTIDYRLLLDDQGKSIKERRVATREVPRVVANYNGIEVGLRVRSTDFDIVHKPVSNRRSVESVEWAMLDFATSDLVPHDAFNPIEKDMQDLLTLCAYAPCGALGQSLTYQSSEIHPGPAHHSGEVEILGRQVYRTKKQENEKQHHDYLFTLADLDFPELVPKWLALKDRARTGCDILFGLRYISNGYVGTRLLGVASAAENLHRALRPSTTPLPRPQYKELKKKLMAAISYESEAVQTFVMMGLRNNPSYKERLLDLAEIPDAEIADRLLTDRECWTTMLKNARNYLAHANERSDDDSDSTPAFWLLEVTYALLCFVIMAELGLTAEVQHRALMHPEITWAAHQFKKVVTAATVDDADGPEEPRT